MKRYEVIRKISSKTVKFFVFLKLIPCLLQNSIAKRRRIEKYITLEYCKKSLRSSFVLLLIYNTNYKGYIVYYCLSSYTFV